MNKLRSEDKSESVRNLAKSDTKNEANNTLPGDFYGRTISWMKNPTKDGFIVLLQQLCSFFDLNMDILKKKLSLLFEKYVPDTHSSKEEINNYLEMIQKNQEGKCQMVEGYLNILFTTHKYTLFTESELVFYTAKKLYDVDQNAAAEFSKSRLYKKAITNLERYVKYTFDANPETIRMQNATDRVVKSRVKKLVKIIHNFEIQDKKAKEEVIESVIDFAVVYFNDPSHEGYKGWTEKMSPTDRKSFLESAFTEQLKNLESPDLEA